MQLLSSRAINQLLHPSSPPGKRSHSLSTPSQPFPANSNHPGCARELSSLSRALTRLRCIGSLFRFHHQSSQPIHQSKTAIFLRALTKSANIPPFFPSLPFLHPQSFPPDPLSLATTHYIHAPSKSSCLLFPPRSIIVRTHTVDLAAVLLAPLSRTVAASHPLSCRLVSIVTYRLLDTLTIAVRKNALPCQSCGNFLVLFRRSAESAVRRSFRAEGRCRA